MCVCDKILKFLGEEGYVFVMGDNRRDSQDSRSYRIGLVPVDDIKGKILMRVYPFRKFGLID